MPPPLPLFQAAGNPNNFICVVARTPEILINNNVFWQYCSNITKTGFVDTAILPETNLHVKSSIARLCCSNIAAIGCQKPYILVRENLFALLYYEKFGWGIKKLSAVYCKLTFVAKNLIGPLSCNCKNACFSFKATNMEDVLTQLLMTN